MREDREDERKSTTTRGEIQGKQTQADRQTQEQGKAGARFAQHLHP